MFLILWRLKHLENLLEIHYLMLNFKKYYINGNRFNIDIHFSPEKYWNNLMGKLYKLITVKIIQRKCSHEDLTIVASDLDYAVLYCYICGKEWSEKI